MLRLLMVVCTLGAEWKDPEKIPVKDIINIWRSQSKRGRYQGEIWLGKKPFSFKRHIC